MYLTAWAAATGDRFSQDFANVRGLNGGSVKLIISNYFRFTSTTPIRLHNVVSKRTLDPRGTRTECRKGLELRTNNGAFQCAIWESAWRQNQHKPKWAVTITVQKWLLNGESLGIRPLCISKLHHFSDINLEVLKTTALVGD
jgi:hypothetical protein